MAITLGAQIKRLKHISLRSQKLGNPPTWGLRTQMKPMEQPCKMTILAGERRKNPIDTKTKGLDSTHPVD